MISRKIIAMYVQSLYKFTLYIFFRSCVSETISETSKRYVREIEYGTKEYNLTLHLAVS